MALTSLAPDRAMFVTGLCVSLKVAVCREDGVGHRPEWFEQFLADRGTRKPSAHTLKAYRQDFDAIASLVADDRQDLVHLPVAVIDTDAMRSAFAEYARTHEAASIRRCWSTWNAGCTFLFTAELIPANPMPMIGRPKQPKSLPARRHHHRVDAHRVRPLRRDPRGILDPAVLVELERIVHLPVHLRTHRGESDAPDRPPQDRQDATEVARRRGHRTAQLPTR